MTPTLRAATLAALALAAAGCASTPDDRRLTGQVIGGAAGAAIGQGFGSGSGRVAATAAGAVVGAIVGGELADD
jgi:uncharacterized protein YcfJ